jgi:hypothetical protein
MVQFPKPEGPVWAVELQRLFFKYRMFQFLLPSFQWLVFGGTSIKAFPLSPLKAAGVTHKIHSSKVFLSSPQSLFVMIL